MRLLTLFVLVSLIALGCQTPRLTEGCKRSVSSAVGPIYETKDRMKKDALEDGDVRRARVLLEETRRILEVSACDDRDRAANKFNEVREQFEAAERTVKALEDHRGVEWAAEVAVRDLQPTFDLEWRWKADGRTLSDEEMERL